MKHRNVILLMIAQINLFPQYQPQTTIYIGEIANFSNKVDMFKSNLIKLSKIKCLKKENFTKEIVQNINFFNEMVKFQVTIRKDFKVVLV